MKIRYASDLHDEFQDSPADYFAFPPEHDDKETILALVGDVNSKSGQLADKLAKLCDQFKWVLFVPGNHEFYGGVYSDAWFHNLKEDVNKDNFKVFWPDEPAIDIDGVRFIGSTLWYDPSRFGEIAEYTATYYMNDFRLIYFDDGQSIRKLTADKVRELHRQTVDVFQRKLDETPEDMPVVILTHHQPLEALKGLITGKEFFVSKHSGSVDHCYYNNLLGLYERKGLITISGHIHEVFAGYHEGNFFATNCHGYKGEGSRSRIKDRNFNSNAYIKV